MFTIGTLPRNTKCGDGGRTPLHAARSCEHRATHIFLPTLALNKLPLNKLSLIRQSEFLPKGPLHPRHSLQMVGTRE